MPLSLIESNTTRNYHPAETYNFSQGNTNGNIIYGQGVPIHTPELYQSWTFLDIDSGNLYVYNGLGWGVLSAGGGGAVASVFGRAGAVVAQAGDYTASLITNVPAGNIASTDIQAAINELDVEKEQAITATTAVDYYRGDKTFQTLNTAAVPELTNLYFTDARSIASPLTGFVSGAGTVLATDSILEAIQKLDGNIVDEVIENAGALAGAAPVGARWGVDTTTGQAYYVLAGNWTVVPGSAADIKTTVSDQTGANGTGITTPTTAPAGTPEIGDVHIEIYDDVTLYFTAIAADWVAPTVVQTPRDFVNFAAATTASDDAVGLGGTAVTAARSDHKHAAQGVSADALNSLTVGTDGLHYFVETDEVIENAGALAGAAPAGAQWGVDTTSGQAYYVVAGNWTAVPVASVDLNTTVAQVAGNGTGITTPSSPPGATPDIGDTHIEIYDDVTLYFTAIATNWTAPTTIETPRDFVNFADATTASDDAVGLGGTAVTAARSDHKHIAQSPSADALNSITAGTDGLHFYQAPTAANAISPAADDATGAIGAATTEFALEDHKHPAQGVSADALNSLTVGTDGLHYFAETDEVIENAGALAGAAPTGAQWGIDTTTGDTYYVDTGNWTASPAGSTPASRTAVADADATVVADTDITAMTALTAPRTLTLPLASAVTVGKIHTIKDESGAAATNNITVDGNGAETIDGAATVTITANYGAIQLYSTGTAWFSA